MLFDVYLGKAENYLNATLTLTEVIDSYITHHVRPEKSAHRITYIHSRKLEKLFNEKFQK